MPRKSEQALQNRSHKDKIREPERTAARKAEKVAAEKAKEEKRKYNREAKRKQRAKKEAAAVAAISSTKPKKSKKKVMFSSLVRYSTLRATPTSSPPPQTPPPQTPPPQTPHADTMIALVQSSMQKQAENDVQLYKFAEAYISSVKKQAEAVEKQAEAVQKQGEAVQKQGELLESLTKAKHDQNAMLNNVIVAFTPQQPRKLRLNGEADDDEAEEGVGYVNLFESPQAIDVGVEDEAEEKYESAAEEGEGDAEVEEASEDEDEDEELRMFMEVIQNLSHKALLKKLTVRYISGLQREWRMECFEYCRAEELMEDAITRDVLTKAQLKAFLKKEGITDCEKLVKYQLVEAVEEVLNQYYAV